VCASLTQRKEIATMADLKQVTVNWDEQDRPVITVTYASDNDGSSGAVADPDEWLTELANRVKDNGVRFLTQMLEANEAREFISIADLAKEAGVEKKVVDGWNRNLGRSVKAVVRDLGFLRTEAEDGTQQVFDYSWDQPNNQWLYIIPTRYRAPLKNALENR
jgi:hypothetical protein